MTTPIPIQLVEAISGGNICMADPVIAGLIQSAELRIGVSFCPDKRNYLVAYLACHMHTLATRNGDAGFVTERKEGDLGVKYNDNQTVLANADSLDVTSYGKIYKELCRECIGVSARSAF